jgi:hypothetical protein
MADSDLTARDLIYLIKLESSLIFSQKPGIEPYLESLPSTSYLSHLIFTIHHIKLHNEKPHNLYCSPSTIRIIESRRMRWGHEA